MPSALIPEAIPTPWGAGPSLLGGTSTEEGLALGINLLPRGLVDVCLLN